MGESIYTLQQLLGQIREVISSEFPFSVWVKGEVKELSVARNGHCYLTLTENNMLTGALLAQVRCTIWSSHYRSIATRFEQETGRALGGGIAILALAFVKYSEQYGLSLDIIDIDPSFTVGEAFAERQRTIERLTKEGMMDLNGQLTLPELPRRLAVVSSATAAGYGDFMDHLHNNPYGFNFVSELFPAPMQGADAPAGIIAALDAVAARAAEFDAALILRGGGSATDLACFDDYDLALNIAQFPLPVLTAIGHERDVHVADMVAFENVKTPTALADFFVDIFAQEDYRVQMLAGRLQMAVRGKVLEQKSRIDRSVAAVRASVVLKVAAQRERINLLEYKVNVLNPAAILAKGFTLTLKNGRRVTSAGQLAAGDNITIVLGDGNVKGTIK